MYKIKQIRDLFTPRDGSKTLASGVALGSTEEQMQYQSRIIVKPVSL